MGIASAAPFPPQCGSPRQLGRFFSPPSGERSPEADFSLRNLIFCISARPVFCFSRLEPQKEGVDLTGSGSAVPYWQVSPPSFHKRSLLIRFERIPYFRRGLVKVGSPLLASAPNDPSAGFLFTQARVWLVPSAADGVKSLRKRFLESLRRVHSGLHLPEFPGNPGHLRGFPLF